MYLFKKQFKQLTVKDLSNTKISLLYVGTLIASVTLSIVGLSALTWITRIL